MNGFRIRHVRIAAVAAIAGAISFGFPGVAAAQAAAPAAGPQSRPQQATRQQAAGAVPERLFQAWDKDHNGVLSQQEFVSGWQGARQRIVSAEQRLQQHFKAADANHDGAIDAAEYASMPIVRNAGAKAPAFATFDANHDQRLEPGEYVAMLRRFPAARAPAKAPAASANGGKR